MLESVGMLIHGGFSSRRLLAFWLGGFWLAAVAVAQAPWIESFEPEAARQDWQSVIIRGAELDGVDRVEARWRGEDGSFASLRLPFLRKSAGELQVELSDGLPLGEQQWCVIAGGDNGSRTACHPFAILPPRAPEITSLEPTPVYNTRDTELVLAGEAFPAVDTVVLDELPPGPGELRLELVETSETRITVRIPGGLTPGSYPLAVRFKHGSPTLTPIQIHGPIHPKVASIEPPAVLGYQEAVDVELHGENLSLASGGFPDAACWDEQDATCEVVRVDEHHLRFSLRQAESGENPLLGGARVYEGPLTFPDGSAIPLRFEVLERAAPWTFSTWLFFLAAAVVLPFFIFIQTAAPEDGFPEALEEHWKKLEPPSRWLILKWTPLYLVMGTMLLAMASLFEGTESLNFVWTVIFMGANGVLLTLLLIAVGRLPGKRSWRFLLGSGLGLAIVASPFLLTLLTRTAWSIHVQAGILFVLLVWSVVNMGRTREAIIQARDAAPEDEQILLQLEPLLLEKGEVTAEDFEKASQPQLERVFRQFAAENEARLDLAPDPDAPALSLLRAKNVRSVGKLFAAWRAADDQDARNRVLDIAAEALARYFLLSPLPQSESPVAAPEDVTVRFFDPRELRGLLPPSFPVLFAADPHLVGERGATLKKLLNHLDPPKRFTLLLSAQTLDKSELERFRRQHAENLVGLDEGSLKRILAQKGGVTRGFMRALQEQIDLLIFNPYRAEMPTTPDMFYGRQQELQDVAETLKSRRSAVLLGVRKSGKSSLLAAAATFLRGRGLEPVFLNCQTVETHEHFLDELSQVENPPWPGALGVDDLHGLSRHLRETARTSERKIVFLLDEIDELVRHDVGRNERLLKIFRALSQEDTCQFVFTGERKFLDEAANPDSRLFNFAHQVFLGLFEPEETRRLVTRPMELIGISLDDAEKLVELVHTHTAGHPQLIQALCDQCLGEVDPQEPRLTPALVQEVATRSQFQDILRQTFWSQATALEKAMSLNVASQGSVTQRETLAWLRQHDFPAHTEDVERGFRYLSLSQLLEAEGEVFRVRPLKFAASLEIFPAEEWLLSFHREIRSQEART